MNNKKRAKKDNKKIKRKVNKQRRRQIIRNRIFLAVFVVILIILIVNLVSVGDNKKSEDRFLNLIGTDSNSPREEEVVDEDESVQYDKASDITGWKSNIEKMSKINKNANIILDNLNELPEELIRMAGNNPETIDFVANYIDHSVNYKSDYPKRIYKDVNIPYYIQWDDKWGYQEYGTEIIGSAGCAPTSLAMVISGLTGNKVTPSEVAKISSENGHAGSYGTGWDFYPFIANEFNLNIEEIPVDMAKIRDEIDKGNIIVVSVGPGTFTTVGHVMVIVGYEGNNLKIYDPNSLEKTKQTWKLDNFEDEILKLWSYSK